MRYLRLVLTIAVSGLLLVSSPLAVFSNPTGYCPVYPVLASTHVQAPQANSTNIAHWKDKVVKAGTPEILSGYTVYLTGNLTVESGGWLWLENTSVQLYGISETNTINISGTLILTSGSAISISGNGTYRMEFFPSAYGLLQNCSVRGLGSRGVLVRSDNIDMDDIWLEQTTIGVSNCSINAFNVRSEYTYNALAAVNSTVHLVNSSITDAKNCIYAENSSIRLENTTLKSRFGSIVGSYDIVANNTQVHCVNTTFSGPNGVQLIDNASAIHREWFVSFIVNSTNGPLTNASVLISATGVNWSVPLNLTTGINGWLGPLNITESIIKKGNISANNVTMLNPYKFTFSAGGYLSDSAQQNITTNTIVRAFLEERYGINWMFINGDWNLNTTKDIENSIVLLSGNLTIFDGGSLTLRNVTLIVNCTANGTYGISVETNSSLIVRSSTIKAYNASCRYDFIYGPGSSGVITSSVIESVGYPGGKSRGLEIQGNNIGLEDSEIRFGDYGVFVTNTTITTMRNNRIHDNDREGLMLVNASAFPQSGKISHNGGSGVWLMNSTFSPTDTLVNNNSAYGVAAVNSTITLRRSQQWGNNCSLYADNSTVTVTDSTIWGQREAVRAVYSDVFIHGCRLNSTYYGITSLSSFLQASGNNASDINRTAIRVIGGSTELQNNKFYACGQAISVEGAPANISGNEILTCSIAGISLGKETIPFRTDISANLVMNVSGPGILFDGTIMEASVVEGNRIINNNYGIQAIDSSISLTNNTIANNTWYGIYSKKSRVVTKGDIFFQTDYDLHITEGSDVYTVNDTFSRERVFIDTTSSWTLSWDLWVFVTDRFGTPANASFVKVRDNANGSFEATNTTGPGGLSCRMTCTEFKNRFGASTTYNPYNISATSIWNGTHSSYILFNITTPSLANILIPSLDIPPRPVIIEQPTYITEQSTYLRWSSPVDVDLQNSTKIYVYRVPGTDLENLTPRVIINSTASTTAFVTGLMDNTDYSIRIRITDWSGQNADSNEVTVRTNPAPPPTVVIGVANASWYSVNLSWTPSTVTDFLRYEVHYSNLYNMSNYTIAGVVTTQNQSWFLIENLQENTGYYFRIRLYDTTNDEVTSSYSDSDVIYTATIIRNNRPWLDMPKVTPERGYTTTVFNFTVRFVDPDNDDPKVGPAGYIRVNLSGPDYPGVFFNMWEVDPDDNNTVDGKDYYLLFPNPKPGAYDFFFECNDGAASYNYTYRTVGVLRFTVETPRELQFADLTYTLLVIGLFAVICLLLLLLSQEKRKYRRYPTRGTGSKIPLIREIGDGLQKKKISNIKREWRLEKEQFAKTGIPNGRLHGLVGKPPPRKPIDATDEAISVGMPRPAVEAQGDEGYCSKCGASIKTRVCRYCGASQKRYRIPERVKGITNIIMYVLLIAPIVSWAVTGGLVFIKGVSYFYPGHTIRLVALAGIVVVSFAALFLGWRLRTRVIQIKRFRMIKCPSCYSKISSKSQYCRHCGNNVTFLGTLFK